MLFGHTSSTTTYIRAVEIRNNIGIDFTAVLGHILCMMYDYFRLLSANTFGLGAVLLRRTDHTRNKETRVVEADKLGACDICILSPLFIPIAHKHTHSSLYDNLFYIIYWLSRPLFRPRVYLFI